MTTIFDGRMGLTFGQIYLMTGGVDWPDFDDARRGQVNGLCGGAQSGRLLLITGLHSGEVGLRVERLDAEPALDDTWEEIVEVSFEPVGPELVLHGLDAGMYVSTELPVVSYRARYCAADMDKGKEVDVVSADEPVVDRYLLQLWPAEPAPDVIRKQTSATASYWHQEH
ncbi:hypothetical protein [Kribbella endophytica]